jgi:hypothetical protein
MNECSIVCHECIENDAADYLEFLEDNPHTAITLDIDPEDYGYILIDDSFENGWHPGQNDDPVKISKELHGKGYNHLVFKITGKGQFDIGFAVWHKPEGEKDSI